MLTPFGRYIRKLRIDRHMLLYDMAKTMDISVTLLSAVECGAEPIPETWREKMITLFNLGSKGIEILDDCIHGKEYREYAIKTKGDFLERTSHLDNNTKVVVSWKYPTGTSRYEDTDIVSSGYRMGDGPTEFIITIKNPLEDEFILNKLTKLINYIDDNCKDNEEISDELCDLRRLCGLNKISKQTD